jgi:hypothetical protein
MDKVKVSPTAIVITFVLHVGLLYLALTNFAHHVPHKSPYDVVHISIPVDTAFHPRPDNSPDISDLVVPAEKLVSNTEVDVPVDRDRYYLQEELSQPVHVLEDYTSTLNVPIRNVVRMTLYINETGNVDDVVIDEKGDLSEAEQKKLIDGFGLILFTPGMRGAKLVKSLYRVQLEINRKVIIYRYAG